MKNKLLSSIVLGSLGMALSGTASAANIEKAIEGRQGLMQVYAFYMSVVGDMAKGKAEYNAESAKNAAANLLAAASMKNGPMWPQGSGNDHPEFGAKTNALPEIWTTYPEIGQKGANLIEALETFQQVAGSDLEGMKKGLGPVGKACKGCHEDFRAEKVKTYQEGKIQTYQQVTTHCSPKNLNGIGNPR